MADLKPIFEHEVSAGDDTSADETSKSDALDIEVVAGTTTDNINNNNESNESSNNDDSNKDNSDNKKDNNNDNSGIDNSNDDSNTNKNDIDDKDIATEEDAAAKVREDVQATTDHTYGSDNKAMEVKDNSKTMEAPDNKVQDNTYQVNVINRSESESADDESSDSDDDLTDVSDRFVNDGAHLLKRGQF